MEKKELLQLFVAVDHREPHPSRKWMCEPYTVNGCTGATDGHSLILMEGLTEGVNPIPDIKAKTVMEVIPKRHLEYNFTLDEIKEAYNKAPLVDVTIWYGKDKECGACDGEGEVQWEFYYDRERYYADHECPVCDGSGLKEASRLISTGEQAPDPEAVIIFKQSRLALGQIKRLIQVAEYEKTDVVTLVSQVSFVDANLFVINKTLLLIMPRLLAQDETVVHHFD